MRIISNEVPVMKFNSEVVKLCCECSLISPLSALRIPTKAPARQPPDTAIIERLLAFKRSRTEITTARTVKNAAATRRREIGLLTPPVKPIRSTTRETAV